MTYIYDTTEMYPEGYRACEEAPEDYYPTTFSLTVPKFKKYFEEHKDQFSKAYQDLYYEVIEDLEKTKNACKFWAVYVIIEGSDIWFEYDLNKLTGKEV